MPSLSGLKTIPASLIKPCNLTPVPEITDKEILNQLMRLSGEEIRVIKEAVHGADTEARIYLFGSRVDDAKRGGDIDLLILSDKLGSLDERKIRLNIYDHLGEQKIDIVIARDTSDTFARIALKEGTPL
jgi:predicted nucleotidyltransferase